VNVHFPQSPLIHFGGLVGAVNNGKDHLYIELIYSSVKLSSISILLIYRKPLDCTMDWLFLLSLSKNWQLFRLLFKRFYEIPIKWWYRDWCSNLCL